MSFVKNLWLMIAVTGVAFSALGQKKDLVLLSPDKRLKVGVTCGDTLKYTLTKDQQTILRPSAIGLVLMNGQMKGLHPKVISVKTNTKHETIASPNYKVSAFDVGYNELVVGFKDGYSLELRAYNEGIAYRFRTSMDGTLEIRDELAEFNFDNDYDVYLPHANGKREAIATAFQNTYEVKPLSQSDKSVPSFLPVLVDYGNGTKLVITESDLESYPGMFVRPSGAGQLKGEFARLPLTTERNAWRQQEFVTGRGETIAVTKGTRTFPWRVMVVSDKDTDLPASNLVYALASPNKTGDCSWIKSGKSAWDWWNDWGLSQVGFKAGVNTETYLHFIDFASENRLEYIILDEGWYDPRTGDMLTAISAIDLERLVDYGKSKNVGIILWTVFNVLDAQLEQACKLYSQMGIKGFKVDFLDRDDQRAVEMVERIARKAAEYRLVLDLHGIYKPTGLNRTYPNILNFESVFGMEEMKWSAPDVDMPLYDVTFPFIRMVAGPVDYTPGAMRNATRGDFKPIYSNPLSQGTRCHQLGTYVVFDSPLTMLCDNPTVYGKEQECTSFIASLPSVIDQTRVLQGKLGEYIVSARRSGESWCVGGLTNWDGRDVDLGFDFLSSDVLYCAEIFRDGTNAGRQATDYRHETLVVNRNSTLKIHMASGGGFAMKLEPVTGRSVTSIPLWLNISPFYKKYLDADGLPIVSSGNVSDLALVQAREVVIRMLSKRPDVAQYMIGKGCRVMVIGAGEQVCDLPEYYRICNSPDSIAYWNKRARGFGGSPEDDFSCSCGEENLLALPVDKYVGENILVHEFAHIVHTVGIAGVNPNFDHELESVMQHAIEKGLWKNTYAMTNKEEYFAEAVQSFFNCNRYAETENGVHGPINRREKLKRYDPEMYRLLLSYFPEIDIPLANEVHW
ncbi:MAG: glycoside hydrolase family 97 protein [Breznakibacter sp.]